MKKLFLLLMIGFIALAPMASASVRTDGMGIMPQQAEDLDLIWLFPQKIVDYSVVDYRMESLWSDDEWGGIVHEDAYIGHWGLYVARPFNAMDDAGTSYPYATAMGGSILNGRMSWYDRLSMLSDPPTDIWDPQNKVDIFKAFTAGNGTLGIHLNYATVGMTMKMSYTEGDADGYDPGDMIDGEFHGKSSVIGVDLGYSMTDLGPFNAFDIAAGYAMGSVDALMTSTEQNAADTGGFVYQEGTIEGDGINEIHFDLRAVKEAMENTNVLANLNVRMSKLAVDWNSTDTNGNEVLGDTAGEVELAQRDYKNTFAQFGLACNHNVNDGMGKVVAGVNFSYSKSTYTFGEFTSAANSTVADQITDGAGSTELKTSWMGVWANLGVEANLLSWLQFRAGFSKDILGRWKMEITAPDNLGGTTPNVYQDEDQMEFSATPDASEVAMTFGVGVNFKNWNIDLLLQKDNVENFLRDSNLGEGIMYDGRIVDGFVRGQIKYNL